MCVDESEAPEDVDEVDGAIEAVVEHAVDVLGAVEAFREVVVDVQQRVQDYLHRDERHHHDA